MDGSGAAAKALASRWKRSLASNWGVLAMLAIASIGGVWFAYSVATDGRFAKTFRSPYAGRERIPFTHEAWLAGRDDPHGSRFLMLDDLHARHALRGMARAEVLDLLGPPESPGASGEGDHYYLGPSDSALPLDSAWLVLRFDGDGRVTEWAATSD